MRIALFVHCYFPEHFYGTETYTHTLARGLRDLGHDPVVVSAIPWGETPPAGAVPEAGGAWVRYRHQGIPVLAVDRNQNPAANLRETFDQPGLGDLHRELLRELEPDLVHVTHLIHHTASLLPVLDELGIPVVATLTDFFGFCYTNRLETVDGTLCPGPAPDRRNCLACALRAGHQAGAAGGLAGLASTPARCHLLARVLPWSARLPGARMQGQRELVSALRERPDLLRERYRSYRGLIAPTRFLERAYREQGFPGLTRSPFGVDVDRQPKPPAEPGSPLRLGFLGQMAPHKGIHHLIEAVRELPDGAASLDVWGPDDPRDPFFARLRERARGYPVRFRGTFPPERMAEVLRPVELLVLPSTWYENSPLVLLTALATHTPVLVSDVEGMTEFLEGGRGGWTFPRGDPAALARVLRELAEDPGRVRAESAHTEYPRTTLDMASDVVALYEQVLGEHPVPGEPGLAGNR